MLFKKIASVFLTIALIVTASSVVSADDAVSTEIFKVETEAVTTASTLSVSPIIYTPGEKITVRFSASQNTGITVLNFRFNYDDKILEFNECKSLNLFEAEQELFFPAENGSWLVFSQNNGANISNKTGVFAEATFTVKDVCADDITFNTVLIGNSKYNCEVKDDNGRLKPVPFESTSNSFSVHKISAENAAVTDPTCTEQGYTTYKCETCGKDIKGNITNALGHTPDEAVEENRVEPTCTENGSYDSVVYCKVCNDELTREQKTIDALGHDLKHTDAKAATCTDIGWEAYDECMREGCGYTTYKEIPATGHTEGAAVKENLIEATCTENGSYDSVVYCSTCGEELSREKKTIEATGHKYGEATVIEPTYKEGGYSIHKCEVCGYEEEFDVKPALEYTLGDVNNDGVVDSTDALLVLRANSGLAEITPLMEVAGDFNGDGVIDSTDALLILRANSGLKTETNSDDKKTA